MKRNNKNAISLRRRLLLLVVFLWMVPVFIIFIFMTVSYRNDIIDKTTTLMEEGLKNFTYLNAQKIDEAIDISKKTSYEQVIEKAWKKYNTGSITKEGLYKEIKGNLRSKFLNDNRFVISVFYLSEAPDRICSTSRERSDYINVYMNDVKEEAHEITNQDTSDAYIRVINGKIYIIRNLYTTSNYTKFGTLVLELNQNKIIDSISINDDYSMGFYMNDTSSIIAYDDTLLNESKAGIVNKLAQQYSNGINRRTIHAKDHDYTGFIYQQKYNDYHIGAVLVVNTNTIFSEVEKLAIVIILIMLFIIPIFVYMIYFISHHISAPMSRMIKAAKEVEQGKIGMQVDGDPMPNSEFVVLLESFNQMSSEVKYLFDYAYSEKIARKDAKIIALQSQMDPHFLNNTLEMMNWQARLAGDVTVSKMIESLGTLLNYSMDRMNKRLINLSEELRCVEAYLYIVSMRFGMRLKIEKEIDSNLLQIQVPQLILQPLIENAVVHGVETIKSGTIQLKIFRDDKNVYLQIINTGKNMTEEDIHRVENILNGIEEFNKQEEGAHRSLAIQNVNERIKLIYGEEYGLTIKPYGEGETAATITIPFEMDGSGEKNKLSKMIWNRLD